MPPRWLPGAAFGLLPTLLVGAPMTALFLDGPPPAHTGGFGEPTCAECHFDVPEPDPAGSLVIEGLPEAYSAGARYLLTIRLQRPDMGRGGFEIAARYGEGAAQGKQAGALHTSGARVAVTEHDGVDYVHHTAEGTQTRGSDTAAWQVEWTAPAQPAGSVVFHVAGNAADGDESQLGDHVYTASAAVQQATGNPGELGVPVVADQPAEGLGFEPRSPFGRRFSRPVQ